MELLYTTLKWPVISLLITGGLHFTVEAFWPVASAANQVRADTDPPSKPASATSTEAVAGDHDHSAFATASNALSRNR
jgi:hypothetical protein